MIHVEPGDDSLGVLQGVELPSAVLPQVVYRVEHLLGEGGSSVAFLCRRLAPEGSCPAVLKVMRPSFVRDDPLAPVLVTKEAVALGRLNERVPPTPFVVRLMDTGSLSIEQGGALLELPWLVVEYVYGGAEGTTLTQRVDWSVETTGYAFETERAALAVECLTRAVSAVHEVGVIHRDIKPDNVLCCGFGDDEIFKLVDFGVARPQGMSATFRGDLFGTPGYAPPELQGFERDAVAPHTDVFGLAAVVYFLLAGENYFQVTNPRAHMIAVARPDRRSLLDSSWLAPELREREALCREIDGVLAQATHLEPEQRPPRVELLGASLLSLLRAESQFTHPVSRRPHGSLRSARSTRIGSLADSASGQEPSTWSWSVRQQPHDDWKLRSGSWGGDGRCLAIGDVGLWYWDGTAWRSVALTERADVSDMRVVQRAGPGMWVVGGDGGLVAVWGVDGGCEVLAGSEQGLSYRLFSGDLDDLGVFLGQSADGVTVLHARVGGWWLKPMELGEVTSVRGLARVDRSRWLVAGEDQEGRGYAAVFSPLQWAIERMPTLYVGGFTTGVGQPDRRVGLLGGARGALLWWDGGAAQLESLEGAPEPTAVAVDAAGQGWAGTAGRLWLRLRPDGDGELGQWLAIWRDASWSAPMISLLADVGVVFALSSSGGIVTGRRPPSS